MNTNLLASLYGRLSSKTAFTTEKIAVFAPIPSASVRIATAANPGFFRSIRSPNRISCSRSASISPPLRFPSRCSLTTSRTGAGTRATMGRSARRISFPNSSQSPNCAATRNSASVCVVPSVSAALYSCSNCCASSSTISCSRGASSRKSGSRSRTNCFQSRPIPTPNDPPIATFVSADAVSLTSRQRHLLHHPNQFPPTPPLFRQSLPPHRSQFVKPPSPLSRFLHPLAFDPTPPLQPIQHRVQRRHVKIHKPARSLLDQLRDLVTVPRPIFQNRKDKYLRRALLQL